MRQGLPGTIEALLESVQLPVAGASQNCVHWIRGGAGEAADEWVCD